jgi:biotin synthase
MNPILESIMAKASNGEKCTSEAAAFIIQPETNLDDVLYIANYVREKFFNKKIELCQIRNARSGKCSEDCKFCAQSVHYDTGVEEYNLLDAESILKSAREAKENGVNCFGIVTSGPEVSDNEFKMLCSVVEVITKKIKQNCSLSVGSLSKEQFVELKKSGLVMYHHNLETSERFFPNICTTHKWLERVAVVNAAKAAGLTVCSGGLFGLGETWEDRMNLALTLQTLGVDSVPLNFLSPIKGTPLGEVVPMSPLDILKTIALFRICLPKSSIKICGGRLNLRDLQSHIFRAGANGFMIGNYLTVEGRSVEDDFKMIKDLGFTPETCCG